MTYVRKVRSVKFQRNGVAGNGFWEVRFRGSSGDELIAALFYSPDEEGPREDGYCAVMSLDGATRQSWRGDVFEPELRALIDSIYSDDATAARWKVYGAA